MTDCPKCLFGRQVIYSTGLMLGYVLKRLAVKEDA